MWNINTVKAYFIMGILICTMLTNTISILYDVYNNFHHLNMIAAVMPIVGFHSIAFMVSFVHWFLDTWTVKATTLRNRTFNQAKTHHYYPHLVVKKDFFSRNDDAIYGSLCIGLLYIIIKMYCAMNVKILVYSMMLSTFVSLEIHRYAHMKINEVPYVIRLIQKTGIILSRESHFRHHNGKFHQSYDLMSGIMNDIVDWIGVYPLLEKIVTGLTGMQPRTYLTDPKQKQELRDYYKSHSILNIL